LDVGVGHGAILFELLKNQSFPDIHEIHGVDLSDEMIATLKEKVALYKLSHPSHICDIFLEVMNAQELRYRHNEFDIVCASFAYMFFPNRSKGLSEMCRVLKPGGKLVVSTWANFEENPSIQLLYKSLNRLHNRATPIEKNNPNFLLGDANVLRGELITSGLQQVRISQEKCYFQGDVKDYVNMALNSVDIGPEFVNDFKEIIHEEATFFFRENLVFTTANIAVGIKIE